MNGSPSRVRIGRLIVVPAVITLAVTLIRLIGELNRWSPRFFSREAGGGGAIVGIVWLVPVFGIYFALRLHRAGLGPAGRGRAIAHALAGVVAFVALVTLATRLPNLLARVAAINAVAALSALLAARGWPQLGKTQFAYGLAARVPVAIVMLVAMMAGWGTHYELGPPGFPQMSVLATWFWIGLIPQMVFWIGFTVLVGMLFGTLALFVASRWRTGTAPVEPPPVGVAQAQSPRAT